MVGGAAENAMSAAPTKYYETRVIGLTAAHDLAFVLFFFDSSFAMGV
jgi:hypothetical protein